MLIDIKGIPEANVLSYDPQTGLTLGATVPCYKIYGSETISKLYPCLVDSASLIGGIQIQSRASLGGNLCNSSPAADSIPTLIALEATRTIAGPEGTRTLPAEEFCIAPGPKRNATGRDAGLIPLPTSSSALRREVPALYSPQ